MNKSPIISVLAAGILSGCSRPSASPQPPAAAPEAASAAAAEIIDLSVGTVELPRGFVHTRGQGDDSLVGHFTSPGGALEIRYDIGPMAGVYATYPSHEPVTSSGELKVGGLTGLFIVFGTATQQTAVVSFPDIVTNFYATVRNKDDIEAVKRLAMTFKPKTLDTKN